MKPCTRTGPKKGEKTLECWDVQNFDSQVNAVVGAHMKKYRNKWQTTAGQWTVLTRIGSMVTDFQLSPHEFCLIYANS
jgi:hypothetical protein